jgi:hypothetical protein
MNEKLVLTDEDFDYLKGDVKRIICQITEHETIELVEKLIATIESLKEEKDEGWRRLGVMTKSFISMEKENAKLKAHCENFGIDWTKEVPKGSMM